MPAGWQAATTSWSELVSSELCQLLVDRHGAPMQQIADWLEQLGMSEYAQRFAENRIDFSVLPDLTDQDLKDLGVVLGDRRKMLRAIGALDTGPAVVAPAAPVVVSTWATAPMKPAPLEEPLSEQRAAPQAVGERRYLTVMFCDLVGLTDTEKLVDAFGGLKVYGPFGPFVFRASDHQSTLGAFVGKIALKNGHGTMVDFKYVDGARALPSDAEVKKLRSASD